MNQPRDPDAIIATWLDDGPIDLPDETRRAIAVGLRTQPRARRMALPGAWSTSPVDRLFAAAAIILAVGGVSVVVLVNRAGGPGATPAPSVSATPSRAASSEAFPAMTQTFTSPQYGYSIRFPADWTSTPGTTLWSPDDWGISGSPQDPFDILQGAAGEPLFRSASGLMPDRSVVDDWITQHLTFSDVAACSPPRNTLEVVIIGGQSGRLRGFCSTATEIEATVVVDRRVYMFTLFFGEDWTAGESKARALFDAFASTIELHPEDARGPSPGPVPGASAGRS
ncbi:MAG TPA: hypothetical protein VN773_08160 [Verrucomicrobiae bacterium]|nr:hypothetical protein [Verrucomicrobiae bacterium]